MNEAKIALIGIIVTIIIAAGVVVHYFGKLDGRVTALEKYEDSIKLAQETALHLIERKGEREKKSIKLAEEDALNAIEIKADRGENSIERARNDALSAVETKVEEINETAESYSEFRGFWDKKRKPQGPPIEVHGGGGWGDWQEKTLCPVNHYVCGLSQKIEPHQGDGDDTAMNAIRMWCCEL